MSHFLTDDTKVIILLCAMLGKDRSPKPLTQTEYTKLVRWLIAQKMRPKDLLQEEYITAASAHSGIEHQRLNQLLARGAQLGFSVEAWQRNGIWIMSRSDKDYPARYRRHLKDKAPPLLFGVGNRELLRAGGLAIVGSRNVDAAGEYFTRQTGELCARNRLLVVSGGARGVDQIAMTAALDADGTSLGVLADGLLKKSLEGKARRAISEGRLLFISANHPNARFSVGAAMGRNKLIYSLADYGLVVSADHKKGGTWAGATDELKRENSRMIFVRSGSNIPSGNQALLDLGALEWPEITDQNSLGQILADSRKPMQRKKQKPLTLFDI